MSKSFPEFKCPHCFKTLKYNNVVFRCNSFFEDNNNNPYNDPSDPYLKAYHMSTGARQYYHQDFPVCDTAFSHISDINLDSEGGISSVANPDQTRMDSLNNRLCPYCHNRLFMGLGQKKVKYIAVIGAPASGKTTLLAAMHDNMLKQEIGESYYWMSMAKEDDLSDIAIKLSQGNPEAKTATRDIHGPYFYRLSVNAQIAGETVNKYSPETDLVFFDVPGELYTDPQRIMGQLGGYLSNADGIIFVINAAEQYANQRISRVSAIDVLSAFVNAGIPRKQNVAVVINKIDLVVNDLNLGNLGIDAYIPDHVYASLDDNAINEKSEMIKQMMLGGNLGAAANPTQVNMQHIINLIDSKFPKGTKVFATSLIKDDELNNTFQLTAKNCETPLLWLLSRISSFPIAKPVKKAK